MDICADRRGQGNGSGRGREEEKREGERINEREREEVRIFIKVTKNTKLENSESLLSACNGRATVDDFKMWCTLDFYRRTAVVPPPPHLTRYQVWMF